MSGVMTKVAVYGFVRIRLRSARHAVGMQRFDAATASVGTVHFDVAVDCRDRAVEQVQPAVDIANGVEPLILVLKYRVFHYDRAASSFPMYQSMGPCTRKDQNFVSSTANSRFQFDCGRQLAIYQKSPTPVELFPRVER